MTHRTTLLVEVDLDPVPGFGSTGGSWVGWLQRLLDGAAGHYRPAVREASGELEQVRAAADAAESAQDVESALSRPVEEMRAGVVSEPSGDGR